MSNFETLHYEETKQEALEELQALKEENTEELTSYFEREYGGDYKTYEEMTDACDEWIIGLDKGEVEKLLYGDLTQTGDPEFPLIGTKKEWDTALIATKRM